MAKTIGILTGGGDVPGLNPAIKAVALGALEMGYRVLGIRRGWSGLLHYNLDEPSTHDYYIRELNRESVRTIERTGGTVLHTSRTNPQKVAPNAAPDFLKNLRRSDFAALKAFVVSAVSCRQMNSGGVFPADVFRHIVPAYAFP